MSTVTVSRAFLLTFSAAALIELFHFFVPWPSRLGEPLFWAGYLVLIALGFLMSSAGRGYIVTVWLTLPFVLLWLGGGLLNFALGRGEYPPGWTSNDSTQAIYGFLLASLLFLPLAFGASIFGVWIERTFKRFRGHVA